MDGIINLFKCTGMTSSDAAVLARRITGERRIGHAGTLDPAACGVLPLLLGRATRLFDEIADKRKTYVAEFTFGIGTDTLDGQGSAVSACETEIGPERLAAALGPFRGKIMQIPPAYSAIKRRGRRLADWAREGGAEEVPARPTVIDRLEIVRQSAPNRYMLEIECSRGTYVRSLCRDVAESLGTCGHVSFLLRTRSGPYALGDALTPGELECLWAADPGKAVRPMDEPLAHLPALTLDPALERSLLDGKTVVADQPVPGGGVRLYGSEGFIGIGTAWAANSRTHVRIRILLSRRTQ